MIASSLSRKILIGLMILFILYLFGLSGMIFRYTVLIPSLIFPDLQLWRLVTYPLAPDLLGLIIGSICFSIPGEEMEGILGTRQFGLLLLMVMLSSALMHVALFFDASGDAFRLAGPANPAIFMLVGFVYLFPHSEIRVLFFSIRSWVVVAVIGAIVLAETLAAWIGGLTPWLFFSYGGFGLMLGAVYFHTRYQKYAFLLKPIRSVERMVEKSGLASGSHKSVSAPVRQTQVSSGRIRMPFQKSVEVSDEERLNLILDRINEKGYGSLSDEEQRFLREYSRKL
jgi:hypothetical protein